MLMAGWPIAGSLLPAGTVVSDDGEPSATPLGEVPAPLPINAMALDDASALQMAVWYDEADTIGGWHQLHFDPSVDREAILAQARHKKRWPNGEPTQAMADYAHPHQEEKP
jgi:hypothetical protein